MNTENKLKLNGVRAGSYLYLICKAPRALKNAGGQIVAEEGEAFGIELQYPTIKEARQYAAWAIHQGWAPIEITATKPNKIGLFLPPYIPAERQPKEYLRVCDYRRYNRIFANTNA